MMLEVNCSHIQSSYFLEEKNVLESHSNKGGENYYLQWYINTIHKNNELDRSWKQNCSPYKRPTNPNYLKVILWVVSFTLTHSGFPKISLP